MARSRNRLQIVPEPAVIEFGGKWTKFDGMRKADSAMKENGIRRGRWSFIRVEQEGQGVKIENGTVSYWGDRNIALATLIQLSRQRKGFLPLCTVKESFAFSFRCLHLDIARGGVPTLETFKRMLRWLFINKYNAFAIYLEDLYPWASYRNIGDGRGRLTPGEFDGICEYGKMLGIDVFPSLELLGHMEHILSLPEFNHLSELWWKHDDCLDMTNSESGELVMKLLGDVLGTSKSGYVLVGGDETWSLGRGRSLDRLGRYDGPELYVRHYAAIISAVKRKEKIPILWGDMLTGMYLTEDGRRLWSNVVESNIWDDAIVAHWDYSAKDEELFLRKIDAIGRFGKQLACPGFTNWSTFYPDFETALENIRGFMSAARKRKLAGFMVTSWGDGGSECMFSFLDPLIMAAMEIAEGGGGWEEKWLALTGESSEVLEVRKTLGRSKFSRELRNSIHSHSPAARRETIALWEKAYRKMRGVRLPEDLAFAREMLKTAVTLEKGKLTHQALLDFSGRFASLWMKERKPENASAAVGNLWLAAARLYLNGRVGKKAGTATGGGRKR